MPELIEGYFGSTECPNYGGCDSDDLVEVSLVDSTPFWEIVDEDFDFGELIDGEGMSYEMPESTPVQCAKHAIAVVAAVGAYTGFVSSKVAEGCATDAEESEGGVYVKYFDVDPID